VLGALLHVEDHELQLAAKNQEAPAADYEIPDDEPLEEKPYMKGRKMIGKELESEMDIGLFETFTLYLGKVSQAVMVPLQAWGLYSEYELSCVTCLQAGSRRKPTGKFKGLIRVLTDPDTPPPIELDKLIKPEYVRVRLYALRTFK
jgi:hypothetical protein